MSVIFKNFYSRILTLPLLPKSLGLPTNLHGPTPSKRLLHDPRREAVLFLQTVSLLPGRSTDDLRLQNPRFPTEDRVSGPTGNGIVDYSTGKTSVGSHSSSIHCQLLRRRLPSWETTGDRSHTRTERRKRHHRQQVAVGLNRTEVWG